MARAARKEPTVRELDERLTKLESRLDALERPRLEKLERTVNEGFAETRNLLDVVIKRSAEDRVLADQRQAVADQRQILADQRHAEIMGQLEKILTQPREN